MCVYVYIKEFICMYICVCVSAYLFVLLFNGISTFMGYLMPNPSLKNSSDAI